MRARARAKRREPFFNVIFEIFGKNRPTFHKKSFVTAFSYQKLEDFIGYSSRISSLERIFQSDYDKRLPRQMLRSDNIFVEREIIDFIKI